MAAYTITAANVVPSSSAVIQTKTAGATITAGQAVYLDANGLAQLATANGSTPTFKVFGLAVDSASLNQPIQICTQDIGGFALGTTIAAGQVVIAGATAGALNPVADNTTGWNTSVIGVGVGSNKINLFPVSQCRADVAT